jgi:hypothetical protein
MALKTLIVATVIAFGNGCAGSRSKENTLVLSGFKIISPVTPAQIAQLKHLPTNKVAMVQRNGKPYFIFPDVAHNHLYVGGLDQYQAYRALCGKERIYDQKSESEFPAYPSDNDLRQNDFAQIVAPQLYENAYKGHY